MSASSSAASSSLTRPSRTGLLIFGTLTAACLFYLYQNVNDLDATASDTPTTSLHRTHSVHRRRRRRTNEALVNELPPATVRSVAGPIEEQISIEDIVQEIIAPEIVTGPLTDGDTVVNDEFNWDEPSPTERNGQNIVQLLFRVSEDATRRNAYVHRGCQCNVCGVLPISGVRYRCSNCADFDLCESCEAQGLHIKTHIFYKIRVPTSIHTPRPVQPVWYTGDPEDAKLLPRNLITKYSKETGFERPELDAYWEQWTFMANTEWRDDPDDLGLAMDRKTFDQCLVPSGGSKATSLIFDRMFAFYDQNKDNLISFPEYIQGLAHRRRKNKLLRVFEGYDVNGDGFVDRRDFLRMFRSYYVLNRQQNREALEVLDDQIVNNSEAHRLINGRQPLSGLFGRNGVLSRPAELHAGEGKSLGTYGDFEITDNKGVTAATGTDTGDREEILGESIRRDYRRDHVLTAQWPSSSSSDTYWRALANPPQSVPEMQQNVLDNLIREARDSNSDLTYLSLNRHVRNSGDSGSEASSEDHTTASKSLLPEFVTLEDVRAVCGDDATFEDIKEVARAGIISHAKQRIKDARSADLNLRDALNDRWRQRHFYTDEEEGGSAPTTWKDEFEVPGLSGSKSSQTLKDSSAQPLTPHSRSSSRVRFADDDDYETRSNASNSSRSVPERWSGMEIPEPEKDAGKEILYMVTQQAINELLDPLFKQRERIAVASLSYQSDREKYRPAFTNSDFESWAIEVDAILESRYTTVKAEADLQTSMKFWRAKPTRPVVELDSNSGLTEDKRDPTLPQFRPDTVDSPHSISKYAEKADEQGGDVGIQRTNFPEMLLEASNRDQNHASSQDVPSDVHVELPAIHDIRGVEHAPHQSSPLDRIPWAQSPDLTIPQMDEAIPSSPLGRVDLGPPDLLPHFSSEGPPAQSFGGRTPNVSPMSDKVQNLPFLTSKGTAMRNMSKDVEDEFMRYDWLALYQLRELEMAEQQANTRGGWGRINYAEFQGMLKQRDWGDVIDGRGGRTPKVVMDYLGSWIEYCIP